MDAQEPIKRLLNPDNIVDKVTQLQDSATRSSATVDNLTQLSTQLDDVFGARFIAPVADATSSEPTSTDFSGSFLAAETQGLADGNFWLANVTSGSTVFGVGDEGIYQNRLTNGYTHIADDGTTYRIGELGMTTLDGKTAPSFGLNYSDNSPAATELLTNGGFETGDFTGWTGSGGVINSSTGMTNKVGTYYASVSSPYYQAVNVTAGRTITVSYVVQVSSPVTVYVQFYSSTLGSGTLLKTDYIQNSSTVSGSFSKNYIVPTGAQSIKLTFDSAIASFDAFSILDYGVSPANYLLFDPSTGALLTKQLDNADQIPAKVGGGAMQVLRVEEVKDALLLAFAAYGGAGVDIGGHSYITTFVDAYGETDADLSQAASVTVSSATNDQVNISNIPLGKWGTTARRIYRTKVGGSATDPAAYFLLTTINDNTTTTYSDTTPDASLSSTTVPTVNTTGSRPVWPRTAMITGMQVIGPAGKTIAMTNNTPVPTGYYYGLASADANDADEYTTSMMLEQGTYTLYIDGLAASNSGKIDIYLDGVLQTSGQDWYNAGNVYAQKTATLTVLTSGYHLLLMKVNGKNASSTDYRFLWSLFTIKPSAH